MVDPGGGGAAGTGHPGGGAGRGAGQSRCRVGGPVEEAGPGTPAEEVGGGHGLCQSGDPARATGLRAENVLVSSAVSQGRVLFPPGPREEEQTGLLPMPRLWLVLGPDEDKVQHRCASGGREVWASGLNPALPDLGPCSEYGPFPETYSTTHQGSQQAAQVGMGSVTLTGLEFSPRPPPQVKPSSSHTGLYWVQH